jgi:hypothetical protein
MRLYIGRWRCIARRRRSAIRGRGGCCGVCGGLNGTVEAFANQRKEKGVFGFVETEVGCEDEVVEDFWKDCK